jgi:tetratricopeptide (TPR) repeat protein
LRAARELYQRAVAESSALRPVPAARLIRQAMIAIDRCADPTGPDALSLRARLTMTHAKVVSELHGADRGLVLLDEAQRLFDAGADSRLLAGFYNQRGVLMIRFGRLREAIAEFDEAERRFARASALDRANVLLNRGTAEMLLGDLARSARDLSRCTVVARDGDQPMLQWMALHNLGYVDFLRGDLPRALQRMDEAADLGVAENAVSMLDRARVLVEAGLYREADDALARAIAVTRADRLTQELGEAELERARCALIADDVAGARRLASAARNRFRRRGNDAWRRTAELVLLQGDLAAGRPSGRLLEPALRVRAEFVADGLIGAARTAGLIAAEALIRIDQQQRAADLLAELGRAGKDESITIGLHARYVGALLQQRRGRRAVAQRQVRSGLAELASYQARFGSLDLQTAAAVHGRRLAELGIALALDSGNASDVFSAAEQARAASTRLPPVRPAADETTAELIAELRLLTETLRGAEQDHGSREPLLRRRRELERAIAARRWSLTGVGDARPLVSLGEVQDALSRGGRPSMDATARASTSISLAMFVGSAGALHALVIDAGGIRHIGLGAIADVLEPIRRMRADLDVLAQPLLPTGLRATAMRSLGRSAELVDEALIRPLHTDSSLVVISTGALGQVPWGQLPSLRAVPVTVAPSATAWLTAARRTRQRRRLVAISGPDLARAGHEAKGVAAAWGSGEVYEGAQADRTSFTRALTRAGVLHVAAHGVHHTENPLFSCLRLADGMLFAHELDQATRTPAHVILSACELGLATVRPGDEALGLASVLLRLGTRSVVAGVARVGDDVAADTMIDYHRRLAAGSDSAAALAQATADRVAPFVCFGSTYAVRPSVAGPASTPPSAGDLERAPGVA